MVIWRSLGHSLSSWTKSLIRLRARAWAMLYELLVFQYPVLINNSPRTTGDLSVFVCSLSTMANDQQINYERLDTQDEDDREETTPSGQGTTAVQQPAVAVQPVMVVQQPMMTAASFPAAVQYMPQAGAVQFIPQPVQPQTRVRACGK